jgi:hypothetical protein
MVIGCLGVDRRAERFLSYLAILETFLGKVYEKSGVEFAHWSKLKPVEIRLLLFSPLAGHCPSPSPS